MATESRSIVSRGFRFPSSLPAVLLDGDLKHPCVALDLSRTGVLLVGEFPPPAGLEIEFAIRSPAGDLEQRFSGRVTRRGLAGEGGGTGIAIEFLALDLEQKRVLELLLARVVEGLAPAPIDALPADAPPHVVRQALATVPVPHRIALAARAGPRQREFLRQDPHPQVLEALARNPNLLRAEARDLASVAHLTQPTLEILATDPRWSRDDEIRIIVATHPNVSIPFAERVVAELGEPALRRILARPSLNATLRDKIVKRLARRRAP